jgi:hypothetical protein
VVSFPHCEQLVLVSDRIGEACAPPPPPSARLALQPLQRFGSFLNPLSAKNICSPAVKMNSALQSEHFSTLSWYSMSRSPLVLCGAEKAGSLGSCTTHELEKRIRECRIFPKAYKLKQKQLPAIP